MTDYETLINAVSFGRILMFVAVLIILAVTSRFVATAVVGRLRASRNERYGMCDGLTTGPDRNRPDEDIDLTVSGHTDRGALFLLLAERVIAALDGVGDRIASAATAGRTTSGLEVQHHIAAFQHRMSEIDALVRNVTATMDRFKEEQTRRVGAIAETVNDISARLSSATRQVETLAAALREMKASRHKDLRRAPWCDDVAALLSTGAMPGSATACLDAFLDVIRPAKPGATTNVAIEGLAMLIRLAVGDGLERSKSEVVDMLDRLGGVAASLGAEAGHHQWVNVTAEVQRLVREVYGLQYRILLPKCKEPVNRNVHDVQGDGGSVQRAKGWAIMDAYGEVVRKAIVVA